MYSDLRTVYKSSLHKRTGECKLGPAKKWEPEIHILTQGDFSLELAETIRLSRQYDALMYDKIPNSPTLGRLRETLIGERKHIEPKREWKHSITIQDMHDVYVHESRTHPRLNRRAWLEANSLDDVLLPTGADNLCPKCGLTVSCRCDKPKRGPSQAIWQGQHAIEPVGYKMKRVLPVDNATSPALIALNALLTK